MWRNYLLTAFRVLARNPVYAAINIGGLAIGLAGCLMILGYVRYEHSYEAWLPDSARVQQVQTMRHEPGQPVTQTQGSPYPLHDTLAAALPQIEAMTILRPGKTVLTRDGAPLFLDAATVDPAFFKVFDLPFADGSAATALPDTKSVVLTESEAIRQFGQADVVGRRITIGAGPGKMDYLVSGVIRDLPKNSSLRLAVLFRYNPADFDNMPAARKGWDNLDQQHYVKLRAGADAAAINAALPAWEKRTIPAQPIDGKPVSQADLIDLKLTPITDVHLGAAQEGALAPGGDPRGLATFTVIALLMLGMAVMNFINLSTARATLRAREVSLRKVLGATRRQIVVQMLGESLLVAGVAMLLALTIVELATPWIAAKLGAELQIDYLGPNGLLWPAAALWIATGLGGGLYPAFVLSRFRPATVLRANTPSAETRGSATLRAALVAVQFAVAIGLIACTWVIHAQTRYVETFDPGYRRDGLIEIDSAWRFAGDDSEYQAARRALLALPGVVASGRTNLGLAADNRNVVPVSGAGVRQGLSIGSYSVDPEFFRTMDMRLLAGRLPGDRIAGDRVVAQASKREINVVVNRNAAQALGFASPEAAIGQPIKLGLTGPDLIPATIIGVVEDTRIRSARIGVEPIVYSYDSDNTSQVIVRYTEAKPAEVMAGLTKVWRKFEPEIPFDAHFAETLVADIYAADRARAALFGTFAAMAVIIACLGLYSLAAFAAERRTREIGIRKVLGATVRHIVTLLMWQFSRPVVLANLIAWPVGWWAMRDWLNGFDARIALGPTPFALAGLLALGIALVTVAGHAFRVARANPIHALRYE